MMSNTKMAANAVGGGNSSCVFANTDPRPVRDSNAELLRVVCMLMIVCHHFIVHAFFPDILKGEYSSAVEALCFYLHGFIYVGVNVFVLITGYYGIKTRIHSFTNLYLMYALYGLFSVLAVNIGVLFPFGADTVTASFTVSQRLFRAFKYILFPFSNGGCWFLNAYLGLLLLSPVLNTARANLDKRTYRKVLLLLTVSGIYLGWYRHAGTFDGSGYSIAQFVYLYFIGGYLRQYVDFRKWRVKGIYAYIGGALCWGLLNFVRLEMPDILGIRIPNTFLHWDMWTYNHPFVLLASIGLFVFVMSFHFHSGFINWVAASCVGVYVLQEGGLFKYKWITSLMHHFAFSSWQMVLLLVPLSVLFFCVAVLIDKVRIPVQKIINKPLDRALGRLAKSIWKNQLHAS